MAQGNREYERKFWEPGKLRCNKMDERHKELALWNRTESEKLYNLKAMIMKHGLTDTGYHYHDG